MQRSFLVFRDFWLVPEVNQIYCWGNRKYLGTRLGCGQKLSGRCTECLPRPFMAAFRTRIYSRLYLAYVWGLHRSASLRPGLKRMPIPSWLRLYILLHPFRWVHQGLSPSLVFTAVPVPAHSNMSLGQFSLYSPGMGRSLCPWVVLCRPALREP